jgi:ribosomal-protein-alanine N-acetyltransferase
MNVKLAIWQPDHAKPLAEYLNNRNVWNNLRDRVPHPYLLKDARSFIATQQEKDPAENFAIEYDDAIVGGIGVLLQEDISRLTAEIGYWLAEPYWGKGIITEAIREMTSYAFSTFQLVRIYAEVFAHNQGSMKALEKNGYYLESIKKNAVIKNGNIINDHVYVMLKPA